MQVGTVAEIWRYPVKSMQGERIDHATITETGIPGDRGWAIRDEAAGEIRGGRRIPALMRCRATYLREPTPEDVSPPVRITLPDDGTIDGDDPAASQRLTRTLGRAVTLCARQGVTDLAHYAARPMRSADPAADIRTILGLQPDEPLPDFSDWPRELRGYATAPGTYFDAAPLHLLSTAALAALESRRAGLVADRRRFRPNLLIANEAAEATADPFPEFAWVGQRLSIGEAEIEIRLSTVRCAMTTHPQADLPHAPEMMRTLVQETHHRFGVYAWVTRAGVIRSGDSVTLRPNT